MKKFANDPDAIRDAFTAIGCAVEDYQAEVAQQLLSGFISTLEARGIDLDLIVHALAHIVEYRGLDDSADLIERAADILSRQKYGLQPPPVLFDRKEQA
jgi:hypothetical protein